MAGLCVFVGRDVKGLAPRKALPNMATSQVETVGSGAEKVKLAAAALLVIGGVVAFYLLARQPEWVRWGSLVVGLVAACAAFYAADAGKRLIAFGGDAWRELKKVVWPTRKETVQMTGYVFAFVAVMAVFLWLVDKLLEWIVYGLILGLR